MSGTHRLRLATGPLLTLQHAMNVGNHGLSLHDTAMNLRNCVVPDI